MNNSQYSVEILVGGRPVREFSQYVDGEYRTFIEGRENSEYQIRIRNNSGQKLLAITAVDSVNVVTGKVSDGYKGRGYIIQPYDSVTIKGYRESDSTVGAFKFTSKHSSYAKEKGLERNCGIIAVNLIAEKAIPEPIKEIIREEHHHHHYPKPCPPYIPPPKPWRPWTPYDSIWNSGTADINTVYSCSSNGNSQNLMGSEPMRVSCNSFGEENLVSKKASFSLGSTWGSRVEDKITRKHFEKGEIVSTFKIYYASKNDLQNMGINFYPKKEISDWPKGFEREYCVPPKDWN